MERTEPHAEHVGLCRSSYSYRDKGMNMTNLQVRLLAVPLVMIGAAIIGQVQCKGIDSEVFVLLSVIPFIGGGVLFICDIIRSLKQNP